MVKLRSAKRRWLTYLSQFTVVIILTAFFVLYPHQSIADTGLNFGVNLYDRLPIDHPAYGKLQILENFGLIKIPQSIKENELTRYQIGDLIWKASKNLENKELSENRTQDTAAKIIAGLKEEFADEIQWIGWMASLNTADNGQEKNNAQLIFSTDIENDAVSGDIGGGDLAEVQNSLTSIVDLSALRQGSGTGSEIAGAKEYHADSLSMTFADVTLNVAGSIYASQKENDIPGGISASDMNPGYFGNIEYNVYGSAKSDSFQLQLSHMARSSVPRGNLTFDSSESKASASYVISPDFELIAGSNIKYNTEGGLALHGVDLRFQVIPEYLSASLGMGLTTLSGTVEGYEDISDMRQTRSDIKMEGQYPVSSKATVRGMYLYRVYSDQLSIGSRGSETKLTTDVAYDLGSGASLSAGLEFGNDVVKGSTSLKKLGLEYQFDQDTSVRLNWVQSDESNIDNGDTSESNLKLQFTTKF